MRPSRGKHDASYWLGLIAFEQGNYPSAIDYFTKRTLDAVPDSPWTPAATYNVGPRLRGPGQPKQAIGVVSRGRPVLARAITATCCGPAGWKERTAEGGRTAEEEAGGQAADEAAAGKGVSEYAQSHHRSRGDSPSTHWQRALTRRRACAAAATLE